MKMEIAELILLAGTQRRARARVLRRMQDYGPRHRLTNQATRLSMKITNKIRENSVEMLYNEDR